MSARGRYALLGVALAAALRALPAASAPVDTRIGPDGMCAAPRRCRVFKTIQATTLEIHDAGPGVGAEYGGTFVRKVNSELDRLEPQLASMIPSLRGQMSELARGAASVVVPFALHFADASRAHGEVVVRDAALTAMWTATLAEIELGPVRLPGDERDAPPDKPRAMWTVNGGTATLLGKATTPNEVDWVLLVDHVARTVTCPGGSEADAQDTRARVFARRTGAMVEEKVLPSVVSPCAGSKAPLDPRGAAQWAWNVLRVRPPKVEP
jgi:hypothetical protein